MGEGKVRVVLRCIVLIDDGETGEVEQQAAILPEMSLEHRGKTIFPAYLVNDQVGPDPQAAAPVGLRPLLWKDRRWEVGLVVLIRVHQGGIFLADLADDRPPGDVELAPRIIDPPILEQHEGRTAFPLDGDLALCLRDIDGEIVVHAASCTSLTVTLNIVQDPQLNCNKKSPEFVMNPSFIQREWSISEV